ncbi:Membrane integrase YidC [Pueribacillus theae]|uniref:Membrane protein insertase YidC n=1 Tax=Pueribacillus theae TaxID=2171751 RepID=A0A2U1JNF4_9BACI|nr:YidC family membrane integrase SpoIIIJ [Pueribacillus theae]PWA06700.1 Membrane integrase YidC [Pueribacillus theae]
MRKKLIIVVALLALVAVLAGCTQINEPITDESTGFWNQYFVYPLSLVLIWVANFLNGSFGFAIIAVTIVIRLVLLPLMIQQTKSSKAMQAIQPEIQKLREKYSSKDQKTQQKLQQETMELFQKHGVNPLAGCMPILIQMPILLAFYHAIMRTAEIKTHTFLWFSLGSPDYILALLAGVTTFLQQKIMMGQAPPNPQMKMMLYIMPVMIAIFAINFPAALSLYWVIGNIFMIFQTYFISGPNVQADSKSTGGAKK